MIARQRYQKRAKRRWYARSGDGPVLKQAVCRPGRTGRLTRDQTNDDVRQRVVEAERDGDGARAGAVHEEIEAPRSLRIEAGIGRDCEQGCELLTARRQRIGVIALMEGERAVPLHEADAVEKIAFGGLEIFRAEEIVRTARADIDRLCAARELARVFVRAHETEQIAADLSESKLREKAEKAFADDNPGAALRYLYADALLRPKGISAGAIRWSALLNRPTLGIRWGVAA